jgi:hypothetical protein
MATTGGRPKAKCWEFFDHVEGSYNVITKRWTARCKGTSCRCVITGARNEQLNAHISNCASLQAEQQEAVAAYLLTLAPADPSDLSLRGVKRTNTGAASSASNCTLDQSVCLARQQALDMKVFRAFASSGLAFSVVDNPFMYDLLSELTLPGGRPYKVPGGWCMPACDVCLCMCSWSGCVCCVERPTCIGAEQHDDSAARNCLAAA